MILTSNHGIGSIKRVFCLSNEVCWISSKDASESTMKVIDKMYIGERPKIEDIHHRELYEG